MKNDKTKNILLAVLLVAVVTLTIAYALLSTTLYVNSTAKVAGNNNWKVEFNSPATCTGTGYAEVTTQPTVSSTVFDGLVATFKAPGDEVTCTWTVENKGVINANLRSFDLGNSTLSYVGSAQDATQKAADEAAVDGKITYSLVYSPAGTNPSASSSDSQPAANDALNAGQKRVITLKLKLADNITTLPSDDVTVSGFHSVFIYDQA